MKGFYFIVDHSLSKRGIYQDVRDALASGVRYVQYRNKAADTKTLIKEALKLRALCARAKLIINDRVDIALAVGADGVHLGQGDLEIAVTRKLLGARSIIGCTVHTVAEAKTAEYSGADYVGVSPVFATSTKTDAGDAVGVGMVRKIKKAVSIPIVAIGGITLANAPDVIAAGADSLSAISAVMKDGAVRERIQRFQRLFTAE